jgi:hypothetical protein
MVGPSYLVKDVYPRMGPVTGGTELEIVGLDFPNSSDVTVLSTRPTTEEEGDYDDFY